MDDLNPGGAPMGPSRFSLSRALLYFLVGVLFLVGGNLVVDVSVSAMEGKCLRVNSDASICMRADMPP